MATTKAPYDPVKALEGMFNGSVTRIAYALKDPTNYGASTKTILTECTKRFHDALDDCEIQLLDAKWYLEHQLSLNEQRREAKAREMGTAAKRKHEEIKEPREQANVEENLSKRVKVDPGLQEAGEEENSRQTNPQLQDQAATDVVDKPNDEMAQKHVGTQKIQAVKQDQETNKNDEEPQHVPDDFAKPTPQATPAGTNDDFNFESMFGDPAVDSQDNKEDDLGFDLGVDDSFNDNMGEDKNDPSSLNTLLPGLESYANGTGNNISNTTPPPGDDLPAFSNNFDLPEIGGPNVFDDFLNDDSLGGENFEDNINLDDQALLDMDFDDMFANN